MRGCLNVWLFIIAFVLIAELIHPVWSVLGTLAFLLWKLWVFIRNSLANRKNKARTTTNKENPPKVDDLTINLEKPKFSDLSPKAKEVSKKKPKQTNRDKRTPLEKEVDAVRGFSKSPIEPKPKSTKKRTSTKATLSEIQFWYTDVEGNFTFRNVRVTSINREYLKGFDLDRRATRTFKIERIDDEIIDVSTGEILSKKDWIRLF